MKFEVNVVNFNNEDVIATSCTKEKYTITFSRQTKNANQFDFYTFSVDPTYGNPVVSDGDSNYELNDKGHLHYQGQGKVGDGDNPFSTGIYHLNNNYIFEYCEDGCNN